MDRRRFIKNLFAFSILPSATTYIRKWKQVGKLWMLNPEYEKAEYEIEFQCDFPVINTYRRLPNMLISQEVEIIPYSNFKELLGKV